MKRVNFCGLPLVASARAAADASGVWVFGRAAARTALSSRPRRSSNRCSLREYRSADSHARTPVTTNPITSTAAGAQDRHRVRSGGSGGPPAREGSRTLGLGDSAVPVIAGPEYPVIRKKLAHQAVSGEDRKSTRLNSSHVEISYA